MGFLSPDLAVEQGGFSPLTLNKTVNSLTGLLTSSASVENVGRSRTPVDQISRITILLTTRDQDPKRVQTLFCKYDDYNWDWSLLQVVVKCLPERFRVIFTKSPRVIHIGDCGVHTHRCNAHNAYASARDIMTQHAKLLFPSRLTVTDVSRRSPKPSKENGGWGDIRDHALCRANTYPLNAAAHAIPELSDLLRSTVHIGPSLARKEGL
ncbi:hypothetical protein Y032_0007g3345 [Ancylostoma ceylanicum]|uniref:Uncharacterized protein n=1 Tax=Ancylostoma ceylanicum TaxID=53326 RepID=A0A016VPI6_9BILA|nr:hypothetical protein Y032_0007g3345 [Ancylostoma ceylanicum]